MIIAYDPITGRIAGTLRKSSQAQEQAWTTQGFELAEHPVQFVDLELHRYRNGQIVVRGAGEALEGARAAAILRVDQEAERRRGLVLTPGAGQSMAYAEKEKEAQALDLDPSPDPADYPFLSAEVGISLYPGTGQPAADIQEVALIVLAMAAAWRPFGAAIESVRLGAKAAIAAATDEAQVQAVLDGLSWPDAPEG
jgi:hypothetical protein